MKIGIDSLSYSSPQAGGREWYAHHVINHLIPLFGRDHHQEVLLYVPEDMVFERELPFNVRKRVLPFQRLWSWMRLSIEMFLRPVEVLFIPAGIFPFFAPKKTVFSVHDLSFFHLAVPKNIWYRRWRKFQMKRAVRKAFRLIVPSAALQKDLIHFCSCDPEKIIVIPHGILEVSPLLQWSDAQKKEMRGKLFLGAHDLYFLFIGKLETKKNLARMVEAFSRFLGEFPDWKMVVAGQRGEGFEEIWKKVLELKLEKQVIAPGYVTEEEKSFLYGNCRFVVFPSLYQGFGMPILEGFSYRRPVLASKIPAHIEVAGDAAHFIQPEKLEEISVGLKRLASDGMLASRLIQKGENRVRKFSWEKCAEATYEVLMFSISFLFF